MSNAVTVKEAAKILDMTEYSIRRLIHQNKLKATITPPKGIYQVDEESIQAYAVSQGRKRRTKEELLASTTRRMATLLLSPSENQNSKKLTEYQVFNIETLAKLLSSFEKSKGNPTHTLKAEMLKFFIKSTLALIEETKNNIEFYKLALQDMPEEEKKRNPQDYNDFQKLIEFEIHRNSTAQSIIKLCKYQLNQTDTGEELLRDLWV